MREDFELFFGAIDGRNVFHFGNDSVWKMRVRVHGWCCG